MISDNSKNLSAPRDLKIHSRTLILSRRKLTFQSESHTREQVRTIFLSRDLRRLRRGTFWFRIPILSYPKICAKQLTQTFKTTASLDPLTTLISRKLSTRFTMIPVRKKRTRVKRRRYLKTRMIFRRKDSHTRPLLPLLTKKCSTIPRFLN